MRNQATKIRRNGALISVLTIAFLLFVFGFVAQEVAEGKSLEFDRRFIRLRNSTDPTAPIGPAWLQEAARDLTSLGSIVVLGDYNICGRRLPFLSRNTRGAWLILIAVFGGVALSDLLKCAFARPRPDLVTHTARVFTTSFPSGHATLSAITYLTMGVFLARSQPSFTIGLYSCRWRSISDHYYRCRAEFTWAFTIRPTFSGVGASVRVGYRVLGDSGVAPSRRPDRTRKPVVIFCLKATAAFSFRT